MRTCWRCGSPPRAWGQSVLVWDEVQVSRFTPTGVGTMLPIAVCTVAVMVHPHGRGDNDNWTAAWNPYDGSPPRAWGQ